MILGGLALAGPVSAQCVYIADCELVWADEFDGTAVDTSKWEFMIGDGSAYGIPGWGNNELQYYTPSNAAVAGGALTITAREEWVGGKPYTSARLRSLNKGDWTYGRFEMRARLPVTQGMWPAFWMLPSNSPYGGWAAGGEIDIMESKGSEPETIHGTIHYGDQFPGNTFSGNTTNIAPGTATDWHVYAVEWFPDRMDFYVNEEKYFSFENEGTGWEVWPCDNPHYLILNLAIGGTGGGQQGIDKSVFPQRMEVDYVRVYQEK